MRKFPIFLLLIVETCLAFTGLHANKPRVAIVGAGGSGLTTAWLLDEDFDVTLYESQERLGGHANTVYVDTANGKIPIEAGFEFISSQYFPHLYHLVKNILKVNVNPYTLTTAYYHTEKKDVIVLPPLHNGVIEWHSFIPHNIVTMIEFKHVIDEGEEIIKTKNQSVSFETFVNTLTLTHAFKEEFLYPYLAANWGVSKTDIKRFAAYDALKYLIEGSKIKGSIWVEITGGTQAYIQALAAQLKNTLIKLSSTLASIKFSDQQYIIEEASGETASFDHLIIATNAMQACQLLQNIPETLHIRTVLGQIEYFKTTIAIHGDTRFMPPKHKDWTTVNVRYDGTNSATTVYKPWLSPETPIFKSWITYDVRASHDKGSAIPQPLYALAVYDHPIADLKYFEAQKTIGMVQGIYNLWFAGNYTHDNDSHESAILSAINVAKKLAPKSRRLAQLTEIE